MSSPSEAEWLWKMSSGEAFYEPYNISYRLAIATSRPLLKVDLELALRHLFRKVPSLRVCLGEREGERWLREMDHETIDLEMLSDGDTLALLSQLQRYSFDKETGPLWCVKVKPGEMEPVAEFKHVYDVFLGINHIITDGTSNVMISGFLVQLLDEVIAGIPVDDTQQLGVLLSGETTQALLRENAAALKADPQLHSRLKAEYESIQRKKSLCKSTLKGLEDVEGRTGLISRDFEKEVTSSFIRRCRAEGVTVNSAFTALASVAVVDLLVEEGLVQESYGLRTDHVINARRYWAEESSQVLGCHLTKLFPIYIETPRNVKNDFWNYAKVVNKELQWKLKSGRPLQEDALSLLSPETFTFEMEFAVTNMGDITQTVMRGGQKARILHLLRTAEIHTVPLTMSNFVHTLCGRLTHTVAYNTSFINPATAKRFADSIFELFPSLS